MTKREIILKIVLPTTIVIILAAIAVGLYFGLIKNNTAENIEPPKEDEEEIVLDDATIANMFELTPYSGDSVDGYLINRIKVSDITNLVIPETYNSKPIIAIGEYAFNNHNEILTVKLPSLLYNIGNAAFKNCEELTNVNLSQQLLAIGNSTFENCLKLAEIKTPQSLLFIGELAFNNCTSLNSITMEKWPIIEADAFSNCSALTTLTINSGSIVGMAFQNSTIKNLILNEGVTSIGTSSLNEWEAPFLLCVNLKTIQIPSTVTYIGCENAFIGCINLESITVSSLNKYYKSINNCLISGDTIITGSKYCTIPTDSSITTIGTLAFTGVNLEEIEIPSNITTIGRDSFNGCANLNSVIIMPGVKYIEAGAFSGCSSLTQLTLPEGLLSIGNFALRSCSSLTELILPNTVTGYGFDIFSGCTSLHNLTVGYCNDSLDTNRYLSLTSLTINSGTISSTNGFSYNNTLQTLVIGDNVTSIGQGAFSSCTNLNMLTIGSGVTSIGDRAFSGCSSLTEIILPEKLSSIGNQAFSGCSSLTQVTFEGETPPTVGSLWASNLEIIYVPSSAIEAYKSALSSFANKIQPIQ